MTTSNVTTVVAVTIPAFIAVDSSASDVVASSAYCTAAISLSEDKIKNKIWYSNYPRFYITGLPASLLMLEFE